MVLKRWEICQVLGLNSWTAVMAWLDDVVSPAFVELIHDYLAPFAARGERTPPGNTRIKEYFVRVAEDLGRRADRRASELEQGVFSRPEKTGCEYLAVFFVSHMRIQRWLFLFACFVWAGRLTRV
jgi:hypothetical protein